MENNIFRINHKNSRKPKRSLKMIELFSFWITLHFIIYLLFQNYLPSWTNPTFWLLYGFAAQLSLFVLGRNIMPNWFKIGVFLWKFSILILGLLFIPYNLSYPAINFNLALFLLYSFILKLGYNTDVVEVYIGSILTRKYSRLEPKRFIMNRFKNII